MPFSVAKMVSSWEARRFGNRRWMRFLILGGINTIVTFTIFIGLGLLIPPAAAYSVAFVVLLFGVFLLSNKFVFRGIESWVRKLAYVGWYLAIFSVGQLFIYFCQPEGLVELTFFSALLFIVNVPLTYLGGRIIFTSPLPG